MAEHNTMTQPVEFLSAGAGAADDGSLAVILAIRPDLGSWRPHNLSISVRDFERLRRALNEMAEESEFLARQLPSVQAEMDAQEAVL
jgi:hypothetical protein